MEEKNIIITIENYKGKNIHFTMPEDARIDITQYANIERNTDELFAIKIEAYSGVDQGINREDKEIVLKTYKAGEFGF